jgi:hypothetical protein
MPPKKKKKQQKKKQIIHRPPNIKGYFKKHRNDYHPFPDVIAELEREKHETLTPQVPTEEELKKEELKNKLKLRYKEISRKNMEINKRYKNLKRTVLNTYLFQKTKEDGMRSMKKQ